jgi:hypothetical protein
MPVVINEIIIRASVNAPAPSTGNSLLDCPPATNSVDANSDMVEKILELLREKTER